jgi:phosphohistidine phosphatase
MKFVILIRHVKSDWSNWLPDFDRPVRDDRKKDALRIAREIAKKNTVPTYIISSPAKRTMQTAKLFCKEWGLPFKDVVKEKPLYEGTAKEILAAIHSADEKYSSIAIVCHNPAITDFARQYSEVAIDNVPTSGAIGITFDVSHWQDIKDKGKAKWSFRPKEL